MSAPTMSVAEASEALGVSEWSIRQAVQRDELRNVGTGKTIRIPTREISERLGDPAGIVAGDCTVVSLTHDALERLTAMAEGAAQLTGHAEDREIAAELRLQYAHAVAARAASDNDAGGTPRSSARVEGRPPPSVSGAARGTSAEHESTVGCDDGAPAPASGRGRLAAASQPSP